MSSEGSNQHTKVKLNVLSGSLDTQLDRMSSNERKQTAEELSKFRKKVEQYTWQQLYDQSTRKKGKKTGINWERVKGKVTENGERLYSARLSKRRRMLGIRRNEEMIVISVFDDHDSAYGR